MKKVIGNLVMLCMVTGCFGQRDSGHTGLEMVKVPDSVKSRLIDYLAQKEKFDKPVGSIYVFNLENAKEYKFQNGIYSFKIMGPHFQRRIFIYNNGIIKIFDGYFVDDLLEEFADYCRISSISTKEKIRYLKAVTDFLRVEYDTENN